MEILRKDNIRMEKTNDVNMITNALMQHYVKGLYHSLQLHLLIEYKKNIHILPIKVIIE